jgi:hypothetical protein
MGRSNWRIPRRTFLRGAGAALALPVLDAMTPAAARAAAAQAPPVRFAALFFPNGVWKKNWIPEEGGADYKLPSSLEPLCDVYDDVLVLSGLDKAASRQGDGHYAKTANFLTGKPVFKTTGKNVSVGGLSIDQLAARQIGRHTPLPSLELGTEPIVSGIDSNVGYTRLYGSYISWRAPNVPVAKEIDPRLAYQRLFGPKDGGGLPLNDAVRRDDARSLLDMALEDANSLRSRLGRDDQHKLDEYMDAVRAVEQRLAFHAEPEARQWRPSQAANHPDEPEVAAPANTLEHVRLMLDLVALAFWTDSTRIATFMFANCVSNRNFSELIEGVSGGHHELSHHQNNPDSIAQYSKINRWHVEQFAYLLTKLRNIREGDGTLLDNSMILFGSSMSDGNAHDPNNLPILLGGRGGGTIRAGRHLRSPKDTPLCNLYVALLDRLSVPVERFGDSNARLPIG